LLRASCFQVEAHASRQDFIRYVLRADGVGDHSSAWHDANID
jgi:hypothetical protein